MSLRKGGLERRRRGFSFLAKVITEVRFRDGIEVNSENQVAALRFLNTRFDK
jgi:hypothetical protein